MHRGFLSNLQSVPRPRGSDVGSARKSRGDRMKNGIWKLWAGLAALAAVGLVGGTVAAGAATSASKATTTTSTTSTTGSKPARTPETPLTGDVLAKVTAAAIAKVGGTVDAATTEN